jgi:hypothetical protein
VVVGPPPWRSVESGSHASTGKTENASFDLTGNLSTDVRRALFLLGELDSDKGQRGTVVQRAITRAERDLGLPADGLADRSLLEKLRAKVENQRAAEEKPGGDGGQSSSWSLDEWETFAQIIAVLSGVIFTGLGFFRSKAS